MKLCRGVKGSGSARQCSAGEKDVQGDSGVSLLNVRFSLLTAYTLDSLELKSYLSRLQKSGGVWLGGLSQGATCAAGWLEGDNQKGKCRTTGRNAKPGPMDGIGRVLHLSSF